MPDATYNTLTSSTRAVDETGPSVAAQTIESYLDDVKKQTDALERVDHYIPRDSAAKRIVDGDLRLARQEIPRAKPDEQPHLSASCLFREGLILTTRADAYGQALILDENKKTYARLMAEAANCFAQATQQAPQPVYYYDLGIALSAIGRKWDAVQAFEKAVNGEDAKLAMNARKQIGRIGPVTPPVNAAQTTAQQGGGVALQQAYTPAKKPNWTLVRNGAIALVGGILTIGFMIGIPIALIGIGMIVWGFAVGEPVIS